MRVLQKLLLCCFPVIVLASNALASCPIMNQGPPCLEYWRTEAVFIGIATRVVKVPNTTGLAIGPYARTTVYFSVEEAFKGVAGTTIVFELDHCGYLFKENERYLVYAHRNPNNNQLHVRAGNTRTRPLSEAVEDLHYIRGLSSAEAGARVFGKVVQYSHNLKESRFESEPLQNVKVIIEGNNQRQEVVTDNAGRYEFKGLSAGTYRFRAELPAYLRFEEQTLKLIGRECVPFDISASRKSQVGGRVLDLNGKPVASVPISLVPADTNLEQYVSDGKDQGRWISTFTDRQGLYRFTQLAPGRYLLIINRTESEKSVGPEVTRTLPRLFYPGSTDLGGATVIVVSDKDEPREYDFRLPVQQ